MTDPRPAPYPADTRAKGWRFELDHERIRQSDTWALAPAEIRPWLLMLWMVAWEQTPCGSLPAQDELIAARIGMPLRTFAKHRSVLLRGWWASDDGRLYHDTLAKRVGEMIDYRKKNAERVAAFKAARREQHAGNALPAGEHGDRNDTGTGTGTTQQDKPVGGAKRAARKCPRPFEVTPEMRAWAAAKVPGIDIDAETDKFLDNTFKVAISDWAGAWRNWMRKAVEFAGPRAAAVIPINRQEAIEQRNREVGDRWLAEQKDFHAAE